MSMLALQLTQILHVLIAKKGERARWLALLLPGTYALVDNDTVRDACRQKGGAV